MQTVARKAGISRREWFGQLGLGVAATRLQGAGNVDPRCLRILNAEGYNPPFYPLYRYDPERSVRIARELNADAFRYPAAAYYAYFPTKTRYPVHPELKGADPMRRTFELCREARLKTIAYLPLNHPFMEVGSDNPDFPNWTRRDESGRPITTDHYGFGRYYEGCLNSPLRDQIFALVREVLTGYDADILYFDGPYQGMQNAQQFCYCRYCKEAYRRARGKDIPRQDGSASFDDILEYTLWMRDDVAIALLRDIREMIRRIRDVPVLYNDTSLLARRQWRSRAFPVVDGFMFEAAETPQQKLFNLQLGRSTGKTIWTYVGHHTQYNREHLKDQSVRGWFSYPIDGEEVSLDGSIAVAAGAGMVYWSLSRFCSQPRGPLEYASGRYVRDVFDFAARHGRMYRAAQAMPQAGVLVGAQTIDWFTGSSFMPGAYANGYHGAWSVLKENGYEAEPFLDFAFTPQTLERYKLVWVPNAPCLSDTQCRDLNAFVERGGTLVATHLTSLTDEYGRRRPEPGLCRLLGIRFKQPEPVEAPDLYLRIRGRSELIPQDPQVMPFEASGEASILAETWDAARERSLGPAIVQRKHGKGRVIYIGSCLEAVYYETRIRPLREYLGELLEPVLGASRRHRVLTENPGLMTHFTAAPGAIYLHLLADTGERVRKARARETFMPVENVRVGIRLPQGRSAKAVRLLRAGTSPRFEVSNGWIDVTVPRVRIHEAIEVELA